jgi:hypothetical protein
MSPASRRELHAQIAQSPPGPLVRSFLLQLFAFASPRGI